MSYTNSPLNMTTLIYQNYFPFLSRVTKGRVSNRHLISRASISIIIIRSIIVITIIIILILKIVEEGGGEASGAKPPMITYRLAMRPT